MAAERHMQQALELARKGEGRTRPNPPVGAVIVRGGEVVGKGFHPAAGEPHAEIFALREAGEAARDADLYVTLEPCSHHGRTGPCAEAVIEAGIKRVFIGIPDPNPRVAGGGIARLREAGVEVVTGVAETECRRLLAPFAKHVTTGLPFLVLKSAVTLDGKTATPAGESQWISGIDSRAFVHRLRDRTDGVMVGIGTVLADNPRLTTRLPEGGRDPVRIVVDARLDIPEDAALLQVASAAPTWIATTSQAPAEKAASLRRSGVEILKFEARKGRVDLVQLQQELGKRGIQSLLLEGGAELNQSALEAGLVDRMMVFVAPLVIGGADGPGIFSGQGVARLSEARPLEDIRVARCGADILIEGEVKPCSPV